MSDSRCVGVTVERFQLDKVPGEVGRARGRETSSKDEAAARTDELGGGSRRRKDEGEGTKLAEVLGRRRGESKKQANAKKPPPQPLLPFKGGTAGEE